MYAATTSKLPEAAADVDAMEPSSMLSDCMGGEVGVEETAAAMVYIFVVVRMVEITKKSSRRWRHRE